MITKLLLLNTISSSVKWESNSYSSKKQTTKFTSANFQKYVKSHHEPPHHDLRCLQIQLFLSLVLNVLTLMERACINSPSEESNSKYEFNSNWNMCKVCLCEV